MLDVNAEVVKLVESINDLYAEKANKGYRRFEEVLEHGVLAPYRLASSIAS